MTFRYRAIDKAGSVVNGAIEANSRGEALSKMGRQGLQPLQLADPDAGATRRDDAPRAPAPGTKLYLTRKQIILFTEELADLLEAGLQIEPALRSMEQRDELSSLQVVVTRLREMIREGVSLSQAMRATTSSFGELYCNLVQAGELGGALGKILRRQSTYLSAIDELQSRVVSSLIYPAFIASAGALLIFVFMTSLVPQLTKLLKTTGSQMPLSTRILLGTSDFMVANWWWMLTVVIVATAGFWQGTRQGPGQAWWHQFQLRLPLVGSILAQRFYTQFAWTLGTLLESGIPMLQGLRLVESATGNIFLRSLLTKMGDAVAEGVSLSRTMKKSTGFPPLFIDLVSVGEQTGDMPTSLGKAASRFDKELTVKINRMTGMIQPVIIVVMALLVGFIAHSILTAIFNTMSGLRAR